MRRSRRALQSFILFVFLIHATFVPCVAGANSRIGSLLTQRVVNFIGRKNALLWGSRLARLRGKAASAIVMKGVYDGIEFFTGLSNYIMSPFASQTSPVLNSDSQFASSGTSASSRRNENEQNSFHRIGDSFLPRVSAVIDDYRPGDKSNPRPDSTEAVEEKFGKYFGCLHEPWERMR